MGIGRLAPLGALLLALTAPVAADGAATTTVTFRVISVTIASKSHDVAPRGASKGDTIVQSDRLLNAARQFGRSKGARVGTDRGTLTFTSAHTAVFDGASTLPGGTLTLRGTVVSLGNGDIVIPVVGGTGTFAHMTGTLTVGTQANHVPNTYRLVSPATVA
jgi:Dirigent-like protein